MKRTFLSYLVLAATTWSIAGAAFAQYSWIDARGVKQYSDMPPPASVPDSRILKRPGGTPAPAVRPESAPVSDDGKNPVSENKGPMTTAERNADFQKRRAEQAEKQKKADEEAKIAADNARNCERARQYHRVLDSGERVARHDKNGERSFVTDEQRTQELKEARSILDKCK